VPSPVVIAGFVGGAAGSLLGATPFDKAIGTVLGGVIAVAVAEALFDSSGAPRVGDTGEDDPGPPQGPPPVATLRELGKQSDARKIAEAYGDFGVDFPFAYAIVTIAGRIGANPFDLANVLRGESHFDPRAVAHDKAHFGLLQFSRDRLQQLGYTPEQVLAMSPIDQLVKLVGPYFQLPDVKLGKDRYNKQQLYMAVFYPAAQSWPPDRRFDEATIRNNPGISTPREYVAFQDRMSRLRSDGGPTAAVPGSLAQRSPVGPPLAPAAGGSVVGPLVVMGGLGALALAAASRGSRAYA